MTNKQRLVIILLGVADVLVLCCLVGAITLAPRLSPASPDEATTAQEGDVSPAPSPTAASVLPPTWTPTIPPTPVPTMTPLPTATRNARPTRAAFPTGTPLPTAIPEVVPLTNADFVDILPDSVPGWGMTAVVNWEPGDDFDPESSYTWPAFKPADDPRRVINGSTLQIESAHQYVKFRMTLYQTVTVESGSVVWFEAQANGFSSEGGISMQVGIDPNGSPACGGGLWGDMQVVNQDSGVVTLYSPEAVVGPDGIVTVCLFAEPQYAVTSKAAFFDDAILWFTPPQ